MSLLYDQAESFDERGESPIRAKGLVVRIDGEKQERTQKIFPCITPFMVAILKPCITGMSFSTRS